MPRRTTSWHDVVPMEPADYRFADGTVHALQIHHRRDVHFGQPGPWADEPDKIAWIDEATGLPCILLRQESGHLSGFVGVAPSHPLFGCAHRAVPHALGIEVHGGLNYAQPCNEHASEERSVRRVSDLSGNGSRALWWFGFSCDQLDDFAPGVRNSDYDELETGHVYRDDDYVHRQLVKLAAQFHAIGMRLPDRGSDVTPGASPACIDHQQMGAHHVA